MERSAGRGQVKEAGGIQVGEDEEEKVDGQVEDSRGRVVWIHVGECEVDVAGVEQDSGQAKTRWRSWKLAHVAVRM